MCNRKDLTNAENKVTMLLNEEMSTLDISKELYRDYWTISSTVENIAKLRTRNKGKGFKNLYPHGGM